MPKIRFRSEYAETCWIIAKQLYLIGGILLLLFPPITLLMPTGSVGSFEIKLALHPDDPPIPRLGDVERIMISRENIRKAVYGIAESDSLGITMCQANYFIMGEDLSDVIREFAKKIYFVHFRNTTGVPTHFRETFHDNGDIDMAELMRVYRDNGVNVPIRVDHVPTMAGEISSLPGYDAMGRLFAIGYLKGILDSTK